MPLRLAIGAGLFAHGYAKLAHGPSHFTEVVAALGLPAPSLAATVAIAIELVTGAALVAGAFVRPAALLAIPVIATAIVGVHWQYGFLSVRLVEVTPDGARFGPVGYELGLVYIGALFALAASAPTVWSIDRWRHARRRRGVQGARPGSARYDCTVASSNASVHATSPSTSSVTASERGPNMPPPQPMR